MSQENVRVVVQHFQDTSARDFVAVMDRYTDDVVLVLHGDGFGLLGPTVAGKEAVGEWFGDWFRQFDRDYRFEVHETRASGDRVFVAATHHGRGRHSGTPIEQYTAYAYTVRDGKISRLEMWADPDARAAALEALGLSE